MSSKYEGNDYMSEALKLLLEFGKEKGVTIVFADTLYNNLNRRMC